MLCLAAYDDDRLLGVGMSVPSDLTARIRLAAAVHSPTHD
jgi:hypothetical protein